MDHTEGCITVLDRIHLDPDRENVIDLIKRLILLDHFLINAEKVLHPAINLGLDAGFLDVPADLRNDLVNELLPVRLGLFQIFFQLCVNVRLEILQGEVIQFRLDLGNTQTVGDGSIDVHGLPGLLSLFLRLHILESPHVVEPVRKLDQNHPDILGHSQEHLSQVLRLQVHLVLGIGQLAQLGNAVDKQGNLGIKDLTDLL